MTASSLLIRGAMLTAMPDAPEGQVADVLVQDGRIAAVGTSLATPEGARVVEAKGKRLSPGWMDLHVHVFHGGSDIALRPAQAGLPTGVTTMLDTGSAGEAIFHGFREYVIETAPERIVALLNIGSIGCVATNRVSELIDIRSIDVDRTIACVEANRDVIVGIKIRASHVITGSWGITPLKIAKKVARIVRLPLMVHVGESPPMLDEVLDELEAGDIVTHCFNGKAGGNILDDEAVFRRAQEAQARGVLMDIGHGGASYSFKVAREAIARGMKPDTISTDLHLRCIDRPVGDLSTTMSKLLEAGLSDAEVLPRVTIAPRKAVGLAADRFASVGAPADLTLFDLVDEPLDVPDSSGGLTRLSRLYVPHLAVKDVHVVDATPRRPVAIAGRTS